MATINLGAIKFNWRGAYAGGTAYVVDDVVSSGGSSYVCILASTGNATSNGTYWEQMSSAGTNGTNGTDLTTTLTTAGDIVYKGASALTRLAKGTASQTLTMNSGATAPEWTTPAAGGAWEFVSRNAVGGSDVASIQLTNLSTAGESYFLIWNGIDSVNNSSTNFFIQCSDDNGSSYNTTQYLSPLFQHYSLLTPSTNAHYDVGGFYLSEDQTTNTVAEGNTGFCYISNLGSSMKTMCNGQNAQMGDNANGLRNNVFSSVMWNASQTNAIRFIFASGNISANTNGYISLYKQIIA